MVKHRHIPNLSRHGSRIKCHNCPTYKPMPPPDCPDEYYCGQCPTRYKCREYACLCTRCVNNKNNIYYLDQVNKLIYHTVGQMSSQYSDNLGSLTVGEDTYKWKGYDPKHPRSNKPLLDRFKNPSSFSQASDRAFYSGLGEPSSDFKTFTLHKNRYVPSRGSSTRGSVSGQRPGSLAPGGIGVDVKHNHYARYLERKKGGVILRGENKPDINSLRKTVHKKTVNNKVHKPFLVAGCQVKCNIHPTPPNPSPPPPPPPCPPCPCPPCFPCPQNNMCLL